MTKADLHVHSKYSSNPADALLKKFGTQESYTGVEEIYQSAKSRGMDWVTITDHNVIGGALELVKKYSAESFLGVEFTTRFPEDGCAVHVLVYDFTPEQFTAMDGLRYDVYLLRDYIKTAGLAYSVAHPFYSVNGKLTVHAIEKLLLLFDVFETVNGARVAAYNDLFKKILQSLTPERMAQLRAKHLIVPMSDTPWIKSFTGGSDEHAGLFIGETYTSAQGTSKANFLQALRARGPDSHGRSNHYKTQVYTFLKIAHQFSMTRKGSAVKRAWDELCGTIFEGKSLGWKTQLKIEQLKRGRKGNVRVIASQASRLIRKLLSNPHMAHQERIDLIYETIAGIEDEFFIANITLFREGLLKGDVLKLMSSITAVVRSFFLSIPFLGTFRHLYQSSVIMDKMRRDFLGPLLPAEKKILWFTDTLEDLNGVSGTLKGFATQAAVKGLRLKLVTVQTREMVPSPARLDLPMVYEYTPEFYSSYTLRFPSLLKSLERIYEESPTEIMVSTPGPVGLIGVLAARLFGIPCRGVYHSDFTRMTELGLSGGTLASTVKGYVRWCYSMMDGILVPTRETGKLLALSGYDVSRFQYFSRGIDHALFAPMPYIRRDIRARYGIDDQFTLLYCGRVSRDKSLGFLARVYKNLCARGEKINLVISGDGPLREELMTMLSGYSGVIFTSRVDSDKMPEIYAAADLFVFPSTMDTFGMSVLEAQSCGVPAMVTNAGGPQEIISPDETGWTVPADDAGAWVQAILTAKEMFTFQTEKYRNIGGAARERAKANFAWDKAINELYDSSR